MRFDLTSKKIPLTAPQNLIAKLFGQQPVNRLLPKSLFACSETFLDKSKACSRQCQNSPFGLKQLALLFLRFAKTYEQETFQ